MSKNLHETIIQSFFYHALFYALLVLFAVGYKTRLIGIFILFMLPSFVLYTVTPISRMILFFTFLAFLFLKSDSVIQLFKKSETEGIAGPIWPVRLIQIQLTLLYGLNAVAKTTPDYLSGELLRTMVLTLPNFVAQIDHGTILFGGLSVPIKVAALLSVCTEYFLAVGFWFRRLRWFCAFVGIMFHLMLMQIVKIGSLDATSIFFYLAFLLPFELQESPLKKKSV